MFTCGSKKKQQAQALVSLEDKCKQHNNALDFISLGLTDKNQSLRGCALCKQARPNEEFISYKEIKVKLNSQEAADIAGEYRLKLLPMLNETENERKKLIQLADEIYECIMVGIQELFTHSIIKQLPNNLFSFTDLFDLISSKTLEDFDGIVDQKIQFQKATDTSLGLFAKIICKDKEAKEFIDSLPSEISGTKKKLEKIYCDFAEMKNQIRRTIDQTKKTNTVEIPKIDLSEPVLQFMKLQQEDHLEEIKQVYFMPQYQLKGLKAKKIQPNEQEKQENPLIKSLISINDQYIAFSSETKILIFDSTKNFQYLQQLDCENDVSALCSITLDQTNYIISSIEESEQQFQIIFWDWQHFDKWKVINAHEKYIWNIINLPKNWIATCSDDMTIKVFDANQQQISHIAVHQAPVNDIALINSDIIISVSDDGMIAASNYKTGEMTQMAVQDCEVKCVIALDGVRFVTGNSNGQVIIYLYTQNIEQQTVLQIHESVVRFLSRIDQKLFVTSSWDGTHSFVTAAGEKLKSIEGPKQNFSEPLLWVSNKKCLIASNGGYLYLYS